jgi:hypothetical protein
VWWSQRRTLRRYALPVEALLEVPKIGCYLVRRGPEGIEVVLENAEEGQKGEGEGGKSDDG